MRRARELKPSEEESGRLDLLEGEINLSSGLSDRAEPLLARAAASEHPDIASAALLKLGQLLRELGRLESASQCYQRLAAFPEIECRDDARLVPTL